MDVTPELHERASDIVVFPSSYEGDIWAWCRMSSFRADDTARVTWLRPDGQVELTQEFHGDWAPMWRLTRNWEDYPGEWQVLIDVNGQLIRRQVFEISPNERSPEIYARRGEAQMLDERTTALPFDNTSLGGAPTTVTFTIGNQGFGDLELSNLQLPPGFSLASDFPSSVAPGGSSDFTVQLDTDRAGLKFGEIRFETNDADESLFNFVIEGAVEGELPAGSPIIELPGPALGYNIGHPPVPIDPTATVSDEDSTHFGGGQLTVEIVAGAQPDDRLELPWGGGCNGQFGQQGSEVLFDGTIIGTFSGGQGSQPLVIEFNEAATRPLVESLLREIEYWNVSDSPKLRRRDVRITLTDEAGNLSNQAVTTIILGDTILDSPPHLSHVTNLTVDENNAIGPLPLTVFDPETAGDQLDITIQSSNPSVVPAENVTIAGTGPDRTLQITPAENAYGTSVITITVTDNANLSTTMCFEVAVVPTSPPGFTAAVTGTDTTVAEADTSDTFTVVLDRAPMSNVVLTVTVDDASEISVDKPSLLFTRANWNQPQTVTVHGIDDPTVDGDQATTITLSIDAAASDDYWDTVGDQLVPVTNLDDDSPGFELDRTTADVQETGTSRTFAVALIAQPLSNVVINVNSADPSEVTVDKGTLTFTPDTWNIPQAVTVTGVDDRIVDGNQTTPITVSVDADHSDDAWDALADQQVLVTNQDNDVPGFTLSKTPATVSENGTTDTFTVVLTAQPLSSVVLDVSSGNTNEVTANPPQLTFVPGEWDQPQSVTVTGVEDNPAAKDGAQVVAVSVSVNDALSDDAWDPLADQQVLVTNRDNDASGFTLSKTMATVSENGTTDTFTVVLAAQPLSNVVLDVSSGDTNEVTASPSQLTFAPGEWDQPHVVTVTGTNDDPATVDGDQVVPVRVAVNDDWSDDAWDSLADQHVSVTNQDNDPPGFLLSRTTATVSESGTTDTFTVVLTARPTSNVVLDVSSGDVNEVTAVPAQLTFGPNDWDQPKEVTLAGIDDNPPRIDGDALIEVNVSVNDASSDDAWDPLADQQVRVTNQDNDVPGFVLSKTTAMVSEDGTRDTFTVMLTAPPLSTVVLDVSSADKNEVTTSPGLIFSPGTWDRPQVVTVTGMDDSPPTLDDDQVVAVTVSVYAPSSDDAWDSVPSQQVWVTNEDNDLAGFTLSKTSATVSESGTRDAFSVVLTARPLSDVVLDVGSEDKGEVTTDPTELSFSPGDWGQPHVVTVVGVDDREQDGDQTTAIRVSVDDGESNDHFDDLADQVVAVTTVDDGHHGWHNHRNPYDVNDRDGVTTLDVLELIQYINAHPGETSLPAPPQTPPPYYDVDDNGECSPLDVLLVVAAVNAQAGLFGQEASEAEPHPVAYPASATLASGFAMTENVAVAFVASNSEDGSGLIDQRRSHDHARSVEQLDRGLPHQDAEASVTTSSNHRDASGMSELDDRLSLLSSESDLRPELNDNLLSLLAEDILLTRQLE